MGHGLSTADLRTLIKKMAVSYRIKYRLTAGVDICHSNALNEVSRILGYKDWNVLSALTHTKPDQISEQIAAWLKETDERVFKEPVQTLDQWRKA